MHFCFLFGEILGVTVHRKAIDLDLAKTKAIQGIGPPTTCKQLKTFMGRVSYVRYRLIPALVELLKPFKQILKKNASFIWGEDQQSAFQKVKSVLSSPPTMISLVKGLLPKFH